MSELINNTRKRKDLLKHMILQLHEGQAPEQVKKQLVRLMGEVPYGDVVEVEQELIAEGLPVEEVLKLCDVHTQVLDGNIDHTGAAEAPAGHPVHTLKEENRALEFEISLVQKLFGEVKGLDDDSDIEDLKMQITGHFNNLADVEKHYSKKENLLFPFLEKHGISGPPTVMWGKHDETRELMKAAAEALQSAEKISAGEFSSLIDLVLNPAVTSIIEMINKEEEILLPMALDTLTVQEWFDIYNQTLEIGYCLYDPQEEWQPGGVEKHTVGDNDEGRIQLPSGSLSVEELTVLLNTIPFDITFVDKNDKVKYFSQGAERIFTRSRAIIGRDVQMCHPPSSVHIVDRILDDFKSGKQDKASFWIQMNGQFIMIEYFAMRDKDNNYLGTLEVSQNLTEKRALEGERRLLKYDGE